MKMPKKSREKKRLEQIIRDLSLQDLIANWWDAKGGVGSMNDYLSESTIELITEIEKEINSIMTNQIISDSLNAPETE